jgi:hypothetical protein
MRHLLKMFALASAVFLAACAKPVPPEQKDFIGLWEAPEMRLLITADGSLDYKRTKGGGSTSINAPIQEFTANGFSAGIGPLKTDFKVSQRPHALDGVWKMTVDGVELTRQEGGGFVGESNQKD